MVGLAGTELAGKSDHRAGPLGIGQVGLDRRSAHGGRSGSSGICYDLEKVPGYGIGNPHDVIEMRRRVSCAAWPPCAVVDLVHQADRHCIHAAAARGELIGHGDVCLIDNGQRPDIAIGHAAAKQDVRAGIGLERRGIGDGGNSASGLALFMHRDAEVAAGAVGNIQRIAQAGMTCDIADAADPGRTGDNRLLQPLGQIGQRGRRRHIRVDLRRSAVLSQRDFPDVAHGHGTAQRHIRVGEAQSRVALHCPLADHRARRVGLVLEVEPETIRIADDQGAGTGSLRGGTVGGGVKCASRTGGSLAVDGADQAADDIAQTGVRGTHCVGVVLAVQCDSPEVVDGELARERDIGTLVVRVRRGLGRLRAHGGTGPRQHVGCHGERVAVGAAVSRAFDFDVRCARRDVGAVADFRIVEGVPVAAGVHVLHRDARLVQLEHRRGRKRECADCMFVQGDLQIVIDAAGQAVGGTEPVAHLDVVVTRRGEVVLKKIVQPRSAAGATCTGIGITGTRGNQGAIGLVQVQLAGPDGTVEGLEAVVDVEGRIESARGGAEHAAGNVELVEIGLSVAGAVHCQVRDRRGIENVRIGTQRPIGVIQ